MRKQYQERIQAVQPLVGRIFHSLMKEGAELKYVEELVEWVNKEAKLRGGVSEMRGHSDSWVKGYWEMRERLQDLLGRPNAEAAVAAK